MRRWFSVLFLLLAISAIVFFAGCGGNSSSGAGPTVPQSITLSPTIASLDLGGTAALSAAARNFAGNPVTLTFSWASTNPAIASVSNSGLVCAGKWDNLAAPIVCTPGGTGTAQITATASGISSPPVTVYVHPHVDHVTITALPLPPGTPANSCYSTTSKTLPADIQTYQAQAFSNGTDVSAFVGPFSWSTTQAQVATVKQLTGPNGVVNGEAELTAKVPGLTEISASISGTNSSVGQSSPLQTFITCPVQSISLALPSGATTFNGAKGTGFTVTSTVVDSNGRTVTGVPLTWTSTQPTIASVTPSGGVANTNPGGASITAACTPPTCNINLATNSVPIQAVYATDPITATWAPTSTTPAGPSLYLSTTGCGSPGVTASQNCTSAVIPVSGFPASLGVAGSTKNIPNSVSFDPRASTTYMGSATGLMQITAGTPPSVTLLSSVVKGKILSIAPDGKRLIVSDTLDTPNQVFVYDGTGGSTAITTLPITGATAASFSPDGLKAFIVAHDPAGSPADHLYVYSNQMPLQTIALGAQAFDVAFAGNSMFGFLAGGTASGSSYLPVCDNVAPPGVGAVGGAPGALIRQLPGNNLITFSPPNLYTIAYTVTAGPGTVGCPVAPLGPSGGIFTPTVTTSGPLNTGQGTFTPAAFNVSPDGQKVYLLAPNVASLIIYDVASQTSSTVPLVGNIAPLAGALSPDGLTYYVTGVVNGTNSSLHVINLTTDVDAQQLAITPQNLCSVSNGAVPACVPDLIAMP